MSLETATYISDLVASNPAASDPLSQADDHMRLIKSTLQATLPGASGALTTAAGGHQSVTDGSSSAPAFTFASEPTLGIYRSAPGTMSVAGTLSGVIPVGALMDFAMSAPPTGWLPCDGQAVSRTTYAALFATIGIVWGAGDGSTTFNVPALMSRYRRHRDHNPTYAGDVGNLQNPDMTPHVHLVIGNIGGDSNDHTHTFSGTTGSMNQNASHSHAFSRTDITTWGNYQITTSGQALIAPRFGAGSDGSFTIDAANTDHQHAFGGTTSGISTPHTHAINFNSGSTGGVETRPYSATVLTCIRAV